MNIRIKPSTNYKGTTPIIVNIDEITAKEWIAAGIAEVVKTRKEED